MTPIKTKVRAPLASTTIRHHCDQVLRSMRSGPLTPPRTARLSELNHIGAICYDLMCQEVLALRSEGATWTEIADGLDVSRQAAWVRFKHIDAEKPAT